MLAGPASDVWVSVARIVLPVLCGRHIGRITCLARPPVRLFQLKNRKVQKKNKQPDVNVFQDRRTGITGMPVIDSKCQSLEIPDVIKN